MIDVSKFVDYPTWIKLAAVAWLILTSLLLIALLFLKPNPNKPGNTISDSKLIIDASSLSKEIFAFSNYRQQHEPPIVNSDWDRSTKAKISYHQETTTLYDANFRGRASVIRIEFEKRNLKHKDFDATNVDHPTNYLGYNALAAAIDSLSLQLQNSIK